MATHREIVMIKIKQFSPKSPLLAFLYRKHLFALLSRASLYQIKMLHGPEMADTNRNS